jgi:hypothetical protein
MTGRRAKAHHEAGHAVIARVLGVDVSYVTLIRMGESSFVETQSALYLAKDKNLSAQIAAAKNDARAFLAGPIAQCRYRPLTERQRQKEKENGWSHDYANIRLLVAQILCVQDGRSAVDLDETTVTVDLNKFNAALDRLQDEAAALVEKHWQAIEQVAIALFEGHFLHQDDIDALILKRGANRLALW